MGDVKVSVSARASIKIQLQKTDAIPELSKRLLPPISEEDDGKILKVVNGKWTAAELPVYDGAYCVTPTVDGQTLETAQKYMDADVKVNKIPYYDVGNTSGGSTVYIADEVQIN